MVDWAKKITKACSGDIQADEQIEAGVFVQPSGAMGKSLGSQLGGIAGLVAVSRSQEKKRDAMDIKTDEGIGLVLGSGRRVVGLTSRRMLIWGHSQLSGKPKGLEAALPLDDLLSISHEKGKLATKMVFEFSDGSGAVVEAAKLGNPDGFIETYERLSR
ncbi:MAG: hypothetical protein GY722_28880 [bacterium]|nr:hypothetical protein [bacterium]